MTLLCKRGKFQSVTEPSGKRKRKKKARRWQRNPNIIQIRDLIPGVMPKAPAKPEEPK